MAKQKKAKAKTEDVQTQIRHIQAEIFQMRNELALQKKLDKPHLIKAKRKEIARLLTLETASKMGQISSEGA